MIHTHTKLCLVQVGKEVMYHEREKRKDHVDTYTQSIKTLSQYKHSDDNKIYQIGLRR